MERSVAQQLLCGLLDPETRQNTADCFLQAPFNDSALDFLGRGQSALLSGDFRVVDGAFPYPLSSCIVLFQDADFSLDVNVLSKSFSNTVKVYEKLYVNLVCIKFLSLILSTVYV